MTRAILALILLCPAASAAPPTAACCRIWVRHTDGSRAGGSGTVVKLSGRYGLVLTAKHVFEHGEEIEETWCKFEDSDLRWKMGWRSVDEDADLAVGWIMDPPGVAEVVKMTDDFPKAVDLTGFGNERQKFRVLPSRLLDGVYQESNPKHLPVVAAAGLSRQGDSGGGVFDDKGRLIGVLFATREDGDGDGPDESETLVVPPWTVIDFLSGFENPGPAGGIK